MARPMLKEDKAACGFAQDKNAYLGSDGEEGSSNKVTQVALLNVAGHVPVVCTGVGGLEAFRGREVVALLEQEPSITVSAGVLKGTTMNLEA